MKAESSVGAEKASAQILFNMALPPNGPAATLDYPPNANNKRQERDKMMNDRKSGEQASVITWLDHTLAKSNQEVECQQLLQNVTLTQQEATGLFNKSFGARLVSSCLPDGVPQPYRTVVDPTTPPFQLATGQLQQGANQSYASSSKRLEESYPATISPPRDTAGSSLNHPIADLIKDQNARDNPLETSTWALPFRVSQRIDATPCQHQGEQTRDSPQHTACRNKQNAEDLPTPEGSPLRRSPNGGECRKRKAQDVLLELPATSKQRVSQSKSQDNLSGALTEQSQSTNRCTLVANTDSWSLGESSNARTSMDTTSAHALLETSQNKNGDVDTALTDSQALEVAYCHRDAMREARAALTRVALATREHCGPLDDNQEPHTDFSLTMNVEDDQTLHDIVAIALRQHDVSQHTNKTSPDRIRYYAGLSRSAQLPPSAAALNPTTERPRIIDGGMRPQSQSPLSKEHAEVATNLRLYQSPSASMSRSISQRIRERIRALRSEEHDLMLELESKKIEVALSLLESNLRLASQQASLKAELLKLRSQQELQQQHLKNILLDGGGEMKHVRLAVFLQFLEEDGFVETK